MNATYFKRRNYSNLMNELARIGGLEIEGSGKLKFRPRPGGFPQSSWLSVIHLPALPVELSIHLMASPMKAVGIYITEKGKANAATADHVRVEHNLAGRNFIVLGVPGGQPLEFREGEEHMDESGAVEKLLQLMSRVDDFEFEGDDVRERTAFDNFKRLLKAEYSPKQPRERSWLGILRK